MTLPIQKGKKQKPFLITVYGSSGIGKTTFASEFENPIILDIEEGANEIGTDRVEGINSLKTFMAYLNDASKSDYKTIVIDSLDHLENLIWKTVVEDHNHATTGKKINNISDIAYGAGHKAALSYWQQVKEILKETRKTKNIIMVAHSEIKTINDPHVDHPYDKHQIKIHQKAAELMKEISDAVLFAHYAIEIVKESGKAKGKAYGDGERYLYTTENPGYQAKNRYNLPPQIKLGYEHFMDALNSSGNNIENLKTKVQSLITQIKDEETKKKASSYFKENENSFKKLEALETKVQKIVNS